MQTKQNLTRQQLLIIRRLIIARQRQELLDMARHMEAVLSRFSN